MVGARRVFVVLAWSFVVAVAIQFLLAGLGILGGESLEPHRQWGFVALHLIPVVMLIAAIVGRMGRSDRTKRWAEQPALHAPERARAATHGGATR